MTKKYEQQPSGNTEEFNSILERESKKVRRMGAENPTQGKEYAALAQRLLEHRIFENNPD